MIGTTPVFGVDNPLDTQSAGSVSFLTVAAAPAPLFPCGPSIPGYGMAFAGAPGELLVAFPPVLVLSGPAWTGAGTPAPIPLPVPGNGALVGVPFYVQGVLFDPFTAIGIGLTNGIEIQIGP